MKRRKQRLSVWLVAVGVLLAACGSDTTEDAAAGSGTDGDITVTEAWARPTPTAGGNAAFYMTIANDGDVQDTLLGASASVCSATEIHMTTVNDDVMSMEEVPDGIVVTPGATVGLGPGALHLMCIDLAEDLAEGGSAELTLEFANAGNIAVTVAIREPE